MTIKKNEEKNGYEIYFDAIPDAGTRERMKKAGYRWHGVKKCWYGKAAPDFLNGTPETKNAPKKEKAARASLWDRTRTDAIPAYGTENEVKKAIRAIVKEKNDAGKNWGYDRAAADYFRRHLRERFPEVKFSITSGGAGWLNACDIEILKSPYAQEVKKGDPNAYEWRDREDRTVNGPELAAILEYCDKLHDAADADDGDHYADYGAHHDLYGNAKIAYDYKQREQTDADRAEIEDFRKQAQADAERKKKEEDEAFRAYMEQREREEKEAQEREKERQKMAQEIENHVAVVDLDEKDQFAVVDALEGHGKECSIEKVKQNADKRRDATISRKVVFSDDELFANFSEMFLDDFSFVSGKGGSATQDWRINSMDDYNRLDAEQRERVHFYACDCVAVYLRDDLQYIIDPQGYTYSRYVMAIDEQTKTVPLADYLDAEQSRAKKDKAFFVPDPISEQVDRAQLAPGEKVTMLQIDPWVVCCTTRRGKIQKAYKTKYAQYNDAAYFEYLPNGARKARYFYVYGNTEFLVYRGDLPEIPREMRETKVGEYMYRVNDSGMNAVPFIKKVVEYYAGLGYTPVINTIPA